MTVQNNDELQVYILEVLNKYKLTPTESLEAISIEIASNLEEIPKQKGKFWIVLGKLINIVTPLLTKKQ